MQNCNPDNHYDTKFLYFNDAFFKNYISRQYGPISTLQTIQDYIKKYGVAETTPKVQILPTQTDPNDPWASYNKSNLTFYYWDNLKEKYKPNPISPKSITPTLYLVLSPFFRFNVVYQYKTTNYIINNLSFPNPTTPNPKFPTISYKKYVPNLFLEYCSSNYNDTFYEYLFNNEGLPTKSDVCRWTAIEQICKTGFSINNNKLRFDLAAGFNRIGGTQTKNKRCACITDIYANNSQASQYLAQKVNSSLGKTVNIDPWCLYSECASGYALKDTNISNNSACSTMAVAGIFGNPGENTKVTLDNVRITATANTQSESSVNIYTGQCVPECEKGTFCTNKNGGYGCVPSSSPSPQLKSVKEDTDPPDNSNGNGKKIWIKIIVSILIFSAVVSGGLLYIKTHKTLKKRGANVKQILLVCLLASFCVFIFLLLSTHYEQYISDNTCPKPRTICDEIDTCGEGDCNNECMNNTCKCKFGTILDENKKACNSVENNYVIKNLPYLPENKFTGTYLYTTVLQNTIYAFATDCNFKYDGEKWMELPTIPNSSQQGFHPYYPSQPPLIESKYEYISYANKVYMYTTTKDDNLQLSILKDDTWSTRNIPFMFMATSQKNIVVHMENIYLLYALPTNPKPICILYDDKFRNGISQPVTYKDTDYPILGDNTIVFTSNEGNIYLASYQQTKIKIFAINFENDDVNISTQFTYNVDSFIPCTYVSNTFFDEEDVEYIAVLGTQDNNAKIYIMQLTATSPTPVLFSFNITFTTSKLPYYYFSKDYSHPPNFFGSPIVEITYSGNDPTFTTSSLKHNPSDNRGGDIIVNSIEKETDIKTDMYVICTSDTDEETQVVQVKDSTGDETVTITFTKKIKLYPNKPMRLTFYTPLQYAVVAPFQLRYGTTTAFYKDNFIFAVNGIGDIFGINISNFTTNVKGEMSMQPCNGFEAYGEPRNCHRFVPQGCSGC